MKAKLWMMVLLVAGVSALALAQTGSVQRWLNERVDYYARQGYVQVYSRNGHLDDGGDRTHYFAVSPGWEYRFVAVCDADCDDLDLTLYDGEGYELSSDLADDPLPLVGAAPRSGDQYRLRVDMASCTLEPCGYAVAVMARRR